MDGGVIEQLVVSGIITGVMNGAVGMGLMLIIGVTGRFHFAYGTTFTLGAYVAAVLSRDLAVPPVLSLLVGVVAAAGVGLAIELFIYRPLDRAGTRALLPIFVSSLGIVILGTNLMTLAWARKSPSINYPLMSQTTVQIGQVHVTVLDLTITVVLVALVVALSLVRSLTPWGRAVRAVQSNVTMAQAVGIRPRLVVGVIFALGSAISGLTGAFTAAQIAAYPTMGNQPIFASFIVVFLAGATGAPWRALAVGVGLGLLQSLSSLVIPVQYASLVVFGVLFVFLLIRATATLSFFRLRTVRRANVKRTVEV